MQHKRCTMGILSIKRCWIVRLEGFLKIVEISMKRSATINKKKKKKKKKKLSSLLLLLVACSSQNIQIPLSFLHESSSFYSKYQHESLYCRFVGSMCNDMPFVSSKSSSKHVIEDDDEK